MSMAHLWLYTYLMSANQKPTEIVGCGIGVVLGIAIIEAFDWLQNRRRG